MALVLVNYLSLRIENTKCLIPMSKLLKIKKDLLLIMATVCLIGCTKPDDPNNGGGNNGNNGGNSGEVPEASAIVSTSEVQYDGTVFIEAVFEDETKMYFAIISPDEVSVVGGEFYYKDNPSLAYKYRGEVVIPESVTHLGSNYIVTAIGFKAFYDCNLVTSVTLPNSVKYIYSYKNYAYPYGNTYGAFQGCNNLTNINISDNIQHIGEKAFVGCPCFTETVIIPKGVKSIGMKAFNSNNVVFNADSCLLAGGLVYPNDPTGAPTCYSAFPNMNSISFGTNVKVLPAYLFSDMNPSTIDIPSSVTVLPNEAFRGCSNLERVNNLENVIKIGRAAFYGCESLNSFELNSTLTHFEYGTFYGCRNLTSISIPNSVITIGLSAFSGCSSLTEVYIPNSVTTIQQSAFEWCHGISTLSIGNSVSIIGSYAFHFCDELNSVSFGNSLTTIESYAFSDCQVLTDINLPSSIRSINSHAFDGTMSSSIVTIVTCLAVNPPVLGENVFGRRPIQTIYVPMASVDAYKTAYGWGDYADVIVGI